MCVQYRGGAQYRGGYHEYHEGYLEYRGGYHDKCGGILSTVGCSVPWEVIMSTMGVIMSTMGGYLEYHEGYHDAHGGFLSTVEGKSFVI